KTGDQPGPPGPEGPRGGRQRAQDDDEDRAPPPTRHRRSPPPLANHTVRPRALCRGAGIKPGVRPIDWQGKGRGAVRRIRHGRLRWRLRITRVRVGRWLPRALRRPIRNLLVFWCLLLVALGLVAAVGRYPGARGWAGEAAARAWQSARAAAGELLPGLVSWAQAGGRLAPAALREGLPKGVWAAETEPPPAPGWRQQVQAVVYALTRYDLRSPGAILAAGLPGGGQGLGSAGLWPPVPPAPGSRGRVVVTARGEPSLGSPPAPPAPGPASFGDVEPRPGDGRPGPALGSGAAPGAAPVPVPDPAPESRPQAPLRPGDEPGGSLPAAPPDRDWRARLRAAQWSEGCRVLIYHTHTSETYRTGSFAPADEDAYHLWNTPETGIVAVGRAIKARLETVYGIPTCHSTAIHDWPSHPRAYIQSRATVQELLAQNPQVELVLDVHRDAPAGLVATVAGRRA